MFNGGPAHVLHSWVFALRQIYMLQQRNNDLAWSNEELLRMKQSDAAYTELEDQKALMEVSRVISLSTDTLVALPAWSETTHPLLSPPLPL